jgi:hypothetical protein
MRCWLCRVLIGLSCLVLAGCAQRAPVTPAEAVAMLQTGRPLLSCREPCLSEWRRVEPQAEQLAAGARWSELAAVVLRVGYQDDLTEYYLARAAEGLGKLGAAAGYYRLSLDLSGTVASCAYLSRLCGAVVLPRTASMRLAAIDQALNPTFRRTGRAPRRPEAPPGEPGEPVPGAVVVPAPSEAPEPVPTAATEPAPPPPMPAPPPIAPAPRPAAPTPRAVPPAGSDYIEPPPVAR